MRARRKPEVEDDVPAAADPARQRILAELGLMDEAELALLYECGIKALKNRAQSELPPYFRAGGKRLFFREDVIDFFKRRRND